MSKGSNTGTSAKKAIGRARKRLREPDDYDGLFQEDVNKQRKATESKGNKTGLRIPLISIGFWPILVNSNSARI